MTDKNPSVFITPEMQIKLIIKGILSNKIEELDPGTVALLVQKVNGNKGFDVDYHDVVKELERINYDLKNRLEVTI